MSESVMHVTDADFEEKIERAEGYVLVDFWAPWCGPCVRVSPIYDKLSQEPEYEGKFKFCKVNVDENPQSAMKYQIMSIPMQMFFVDGKKVDELLGAVPEETIRSKVNDVMQSFPTDETGRLKVILSSWTEHNKQYSQKLRSWAGNTQGADENTVYGDILQAAREMEKANERLSQSLLGLTEGK